VTVDASNESAVLTVALPAAILNSFADANLNVEVKLSQGAIAIPAAIAKQIAEQTTQTGGNISVSITNVDKASLTLTTTQQAQLNKGQNVSVFDISLRGSNTFIQTSFSSGKLQISLPYDLPSGKRAFVLYLGDNGEYTKIYPTYNSGMVTFPIDHLSTFAVAYENIIIPSGGGGGGGSSSISIVDEIVPETASPGGFELNKSSFSKIGGENRVTTSVTISRRGWQSASTVILAPGANANLVDALAAAPLASQENAPILLGWGDRPDPEVVSELKRLGAKKIIAVGALSQNLINALKAQVPGLEVEVLRGSNRLATALLVGQKVQNPKGLIIVGYDAMADAVSIASWAAANNYLIQPANADGTFTGDTSLGGYILGGPTLVKDIPGFTRIYGADRYATNKAIRDTLNFEYGSVYTADGTTLVDALTGAALAAQTMSPIVLLPNNDPTGADFTGVTEQTKLYSFGNK
jgi:hypothetical protein